jgi:hypothetical protein
VKPVKRARGQTAIYGEWEWIYAPLGLKDTTWRQIHEERKKGVKIRVINWPAGTDAPEPKWLVSPTVGVTPNWLWPKLTRKWRS